MIKPFVEDSVRVMISLSTDHVFRNDYAFRFNDLVLKFLGIHTEKSFYVPGATNNARFMARGIYALKLYLFRNEIDELDPEFVQRIRLSACSYQLFTSSFGIGAHSQRTRQ